MIQGRRRSAVLATALTVFGLAAAAPAHAAEAPAAASAAAVAWPQGMSLPRPQRGAWRARVVSSVRASARPGGPGVYTLDGFTPATGVNIRLLVLGFTTVATPEGPVGWVRVRLPRRPNTADGWIPASTVELRRVKFWVDLVLSRREIRVYRAGALIRRFRGVIGTPATPTPVGLHAILEKARQPDPTGFLGPWAIHLTAHSNVLENFGGGPGRVAIHGRSGASLVDPLGTARSHGCIRISNRAISWMADALPLATPVRITQG